MYAKDETETDRKVHEVFFNLCIKHSMNITPKLIY